MVIFLDPGQTVLISGKPQKHRKCTVVAHFMDSGFGLEDNDLKDPWISDSLLVLGSLISSFVNCYQILLFFAEKCEIIIFFGKSRTGKTGNTSEERDWNSLSLVARHFTPGFRRT